MLNTIVFIAGFSEGYQSAAAILQQLEGTGKIISVAN